MNKEIEIAVSVRNPKEAERNILKIAKFIREVKQVDNYFVPKDKDFFKKKVTKEYLRVRHDGNKSHLNYSYCHYDKHNHFLQTDEYESIVENPDIVDEVLKRIGMVHKVTVKKLRKHFSYGDFEITLDNIEDLDYFIEIEAKKDFGGAEKTRDECYKILSKLNVDYEECPDLGYPDMVLRKNS